MPTAHTISFSGDTVGLIVRGKLGPTHAPDRLAQHADCILSNGAPIGFFGEGAGSSFNQVGMSMQGVVYDHADLLKHRKYYVDLSAALAYRVISTVLVVKVADREVKSFDKYWADLDTSPGAFHIVGANCSTHASEAFVHSEILKGGIPGLDTPDNLYLQLAEKKKGTVESYSGYFGFKLKAGGKGFDMQYVEHKHTVVPHPPQGSSSIS